MPFTRWDPFRDLLEFQQRFSRGPAEAAGWVPAADLFETPAQYVITVEVAGLGRDDIQIHLVPGQLTLRGARPEPCDRCEQYHRVERGHGAFERHFALPDAIDVEHISADLRNGVLTVTVPKLKRQKKISVDE